MIRHKNVEHIFALEPQSVKKLTIKRNSIPSKIKSHFIKLIIELIKEIKNEFNAFSYFHLRYILNLKHNQIKVENRLKTIIKGTHKYFDEDRAKYLFNVIFDSLDSIGGGTINHIYKKYHLYLPNYKDSIFEDTEHFCSRFKTGNKNNIQKIAEDIVKGKISQDSFKDLTNPHIQILKEYYRNNFTLKSKNLKSIFNQEIIEKSFVQKFLNLSEVTLKKIFLDGHLEYVDIFALTKRMEYVNLNNEIQIFIIYTLIMTKIGNPSRIAHKAGISRKTILHYAKKLQMLTNPLTKLPFIDYTKRFSTRSRTPSSMLTKTSKSLTGYILSMPVEKRKGLIKEIKKIIDILLKKYRYPYFIKKSLKKADQTSQDYNIIANRLIKLSRIDNKLTYSDCSELFYILLEVYDFIETKSLSQIAKECTRHQSFIGRLAKLILSNPEDYKKRFPSDWNSKSKKLSIANDIIIGQITQDSISNVDSFEFQQIIKAYRNFIVRLEIDKLIQKGYPSIGSQKYKTRVYNFKLKNLFPRYCVGGKFIAWIEDLTEHELKNIIKFSSSTNIKRDLLLICNKINQNQEILKYIILLILNTHYSLGKIAKKSGKSREAIRKTGKLLDITTCSVTNTFYIKSYDERFLN